MSSSTSAQPFKKSEIYTPCSLAHLLFCLFSCASTRLNLLNSQAEPRFRPKMLPILHPCLAVSIYITWQLDLILVSTTPWLPFSATYWSSGKPRQVKITQKEVQKQKILSEMREESVAMATHSLRFIFPAQI